MIKSNYTITVQLIAIFLIVLILASCKTETKKTEKIDEFFSLKAELTNIPDSTLFYLQDLSAEKLDSAYVINGKLSLKSELDHHAPQKLTLFATKPQFIYTQLLVGNEQVTFKADISDFPWNIDMAGSKYQDQAEKFNKLRYQEQELKKKLQDQYGDDVEVLAAKTDAMVDSLHTEIVNLLKADFNSYAALDKFKYYKDKFTTEELKALYDQLDDTLKETTVAKAVKLQSKFPNPEIGDAFYDYTAVNQNGDTVSLSDVKDKYILLHFSSFSCYGSQLSLPQLKELYAAYRDDLEIISISTDLDKYKWKEHIKRDSIQWNYLWDTGGDHNEAVVKYWSMGTPTFVLISPEKKILEKWLGYGDNLIKENVEKHILK